MFEQNDELSREAATAWSDGAGSSRYGSTRRSVALVHFSGPPAIGGMESLLVEMVRALRATGANCRVVVGCGGRMPGSETCVLPMLDPGHPAVQAGLQSVAESVPAGDHPLAVEIRRQIESAVAGCTDVWILNACTVYLNPFLTLAILALARERPDEHWVCWTADLTSASRYHPRWHDAHRYVQFSLPANLRHVAISEARRRDLALRMCIDPGLITVIEPAVDVLEWVHAGRETRRIWTSLDLSAADAIVLVPAKLLAHKRLDFALDVADALRTKFVLPRVLISAPASPHDRRGSRAFRRALDAHARSLDLARYAIFLTDVVNGSIQRRTMRDLMLLSDAVFVPSCEEGYGMPIAEAALLRAPMLCSDIPSFREAAAATATYFDLEESADQVAARLARLVESECNVRRRDLLRTCTRFRTQVRGLLTQR